MKIFEELGENISRAEIVDMIKTVTNEEWDYVTSEELSKFLKDLE